jgi:ribosomal protein S18 acetylase RimI-like enzyme
LHRRFGWFATDDLSRLVEQCEFWNKDRFYEILWEYSGLSPTILMERAARGWLYYENGKLAGFALGRQRFGWWEMEELWGPCQGTSSISQPIHHHDVSRAERFRRLLAKIPSRVLIRGAVDNAFANLLAKQIGAEWSGGFLLSTRKLRRKCVVKKLENCKLRRFKEGDEKDVARIHFRAFHYRHPADEYKKWAMASNCRTTLALRGNQPVGFFIAEKRAYKGYGDFNMAVDPSHHGGGVGSALLQNGLNDLYDMNVRTAIADFLLLNTRAQALYRKHGFQTARAYNYYKLKRNSNRPNS